MKINEQNVLSTIEDYEIVMKCFNITKFLIQTHSPTSRKASTIEIHVMGVKWYRFGLKARIKKLVEYINIYKPYYTFVNVWSHAKCHGEVFKDRYKNKYICLMNCSVKDCPHKKPHDVIIDVFYDMECSKFHCGNYEGKPTEQSQICTLIK